MRACYTRFTAESGDYADVVHAAKLQVMRDSLAAEVERLTSLLAQVCDGHRRERDFTRRQLRDALHELIAAFPVYRSYGYPGRPVSQADAGHVAAAVAAALRRRPGLDAELAGFIGELLTGTHPGGPEADFMLRFAQVSAFLAIQEKEAQWWRDASIAYFQTLSHQPLPAGYAAPEHNLPYYESLCFPYAPGRASRPTGECK